MDHGKEGINFLMQFTYFCQASLAEMDGTVGFFLPMYFMIPKMYICGKRKELGDAK